VPPSSERSNCCPKEYIFEGFAAVENTRAPGSGSLAAVAESEGRFSAPFGNGGPRLEIGGLEQLAGERAGKQQRTVGEYHTPLHRPGWQGKPASGHRRTADLPQFGCVWAAARNTPATTRPMSRIGTRIVPYDTLTSFHSSLFLVMPSLLTR